MKVLIIYDMTGRIISMIHGETTPPHGVPYLFTEIPPNASIVSVDVTDKDNPVPVIEYENKSEFEIMKEQLNELNITIAEIYSCQMAITDVIIDLEFELILMKEGL